MVRKSRTGEQPRPQTGQVIPLMSLAPDIVPMGVNAFRCVAIEDQIILEFYFIPVPTVRNQGTIEIEPLARYAIGKHMAQSIIGTLQELLSKMP